MVGTILAAAIGGIAFLAWCYSVFHFVKALRWRAPGLSLGTMLTQGMRAFDPASFTEAGQAHQRRFVRGAVVFGLCIFVGVALGIVLIEPRP